MIKKIDVKREKYGNEYRIEDEDGNVSTWAANKVGEVVGYSADRLLCKVGGRYKVYTLQGKEADSFQMYINPYPLQVPVPLGQCGFTFGVTVEDAEEESLWRERARALRSFRQECLEDLIAELMKQLEERKCPCPELALFQHAGRDIFRFLQEYLRTNKDLHTDEEKLCRLALSFAERLF